jgi:hypothetical protein
VIPLARALVRDVLVGNAMRCLLATAVLAGGCGTSILLSYPTHMPFLRAHSDVVVSTRALEDPVQTTRARIATDPLHVACETTTVVPKIEATWMDSQDQIGRWWMGFMAISEGGLSLAFAVDSTNPMRTNPGWEQGTAVYLGVDALVALGFAIFSKPSTRTYKTVGPGMPETAQTCPDGLVVRGAGQAVTVAHDGSLVGDEHALAQAALAGGALSIAGGGVEVAWTPDARERCALVSELALDDPSCRADQPAAAPRAPELHVVPPLEFRIRVHLPPAAPR